MKKNEKTRKLTLRKETIRNLSAEDLAKVAGGISGTRCTDGSDRTCSIGDGCGGSAAQGCGPTGRGL